MCPFANSHVWPQFGNSRTDVVQETRLKRSRQMNLYIHIIYIYIYNIFIYIYNIVELASLVRTVSLFVLLFKPTRRVGGKATTLGEKARSPVDRGTGFSHIILGKD